MRFSTLLWTLSATVTTVLATVVISGTHTDVASNGQRPFRYEINSFVNHGPAFDLYIQALRQLQTTSPASQLSYFGLAGIHGYPANKAWDGVGKGQFGFCTHSSVLFPSWHRPYLAIYESTLAGLATSIANSYPSSNRATYQAAAASFRIPYWDWSTNAQLPPVVNSPQIRINTPSGAQNVVNPLYEYVFQSGTPGQFPNDGIPKVVTLRAPRNGVSQPGDINAVQARAQQGFHDGVYNILASESSYDAFADASYYTTNNGRRSTYQNVENLHNLIHVNVGKAANNGNGHMYYIPYSSFDPIFWLHHTNVDRIFAIWQALYPNSYVQPWAGQTSTSANTALTPFHANVNGQFHTSTSARSTRSFGYTYPEVVDWNVSQQQLTANVRAKVQAIYNPSSKSKRSAGAEDDCEEAPGYTPNHTPNYAPGTIPGVSGPAGAPGVPSMYTPGTVAVTPPSPIANAASHQWVINVIADKSKLNQACRVDFYFNTPAVSNSSYSAYDPNLIGSYVVLLPPTNSDMPSDNVKAAGQVPMTYTVLGQTSDIGPDAYNNVLKKKLQYRAEYSDNSLMLPSNLVKDAVFTVEVCSRSVSQQGSDNFPIYGEWITHYSGLLGENGYSLVK